jgi:transposase-like protein
MTSRVEEVMPRGKQICDNRCPCCNQPFSLPKKLKGNSKVYVCPHCKHQAKVCVETTILGVLAYWVDLE